MRNYIFVFLLIGVVAINYSQDINRQWLGLTYKALDSENSRLNLSQLLRWRTGNFNQAITEADFKTDLFRNFSGGLELRYILDKDREGAIQGNRSGGRIRFNLYHKTEIGRWDVSQRAGIQYFRRFDDGANRMILRFRPEITPRIRNFKHDPTLGAEIFVPLESGSDYSIRYGLSAPFDFDRNQFELGYYFEHTGKVSNGNENQHIIALKYKRKR